MRPPCVSPVPDAERQVRVSIADIPVRLQISPGFLDTLSVFACLKEQMRLNATLILRSLWPLWRCQTICSNKQAHLMCPRTFICQKMTPLQKRVDSTTYLIL